MSIRIGAKYALDEISNAEWKAAKGITEDGKKGTNSMLAGRDYEVKCETGTEPLMVINGVWIWYCKAHHQPLGHCEHDKAKARAIDFAESVIRADKTERYEYGHTDDNRNAKGELPAAGTRWACPREMAQAFIRQLKD